LVRKYLHIRFVGMKFLDRDTERCFRYGARFDEKCVWSGPRYDQSNDPDEAPRGARPDAGCNLLAFSAVCRGFYACLDYLSRGGPFRCCRSDSYPTATVILSTCRAQILITGEALLLE
jgi:hypothetical protein